MSEENVGASEEKMVRTLDLVQEIQATLQEKDCQESVVVGGYALFVHGGQRFTKDVDVGVFTGDLLNISSTIHSLRQQGYTCKLNHSEAGDVLGGVWDITGDDIYPLQIVNFYSHAPVLPFVAKGAISNRKQDLIVSHPDIFVCDVEYLISLKLGAGSRRDLEDVALLLSHSNVDVDRVFSILDEHKASDLIALFTEHFSPEEEE